MSFVQKNRTWLLPILGVGVVWAFWNMYRAFAPPPPLPVKPAAGAPAPPATPAQAPPAPVAPAPRPEPPQPQPPSAVGGLWADLKALEAPAPGLNRVEELLAEGERPLSAEGLTECPGPELSPAEWKGLPEPPAPRALPREAGPGAPLPRLDFVIERQDTKVKEAWMGGKGYREGASPDGVHRIKRITDRTVLLGGPSGEVLLTTDLAGPARPPRNETMTPPAEAK